MKRPKLGLNAFVEYGFTAEPYKSMPKRVGRWGAAETAYAIRLMHALLTGEKRTKYRRHIREVLQEELHTNPVRVFKKFCGNKVLKVSTLSRHSKVLLEPDRPRWDNIDLLGYETLQDYVVSKPLQELREQFLSSTYFEVSESLTHVA